MPADTLFDLPPAGPAVHCFFQPCSHVVRASTPEVAHEAMEDHYRTAHADDIRNALAYLRGKP
jgi:hypothetical protein